MLTVCPQSAIACLLLLLPMASYSKEIKSDTDLIRYMLCCDEEFNAAAPVDYIQKNKSPKLVQLLASELNFFGQRNDGQTAAKYRILFSELHEKGESNFVLSILSHQSLKADVPWLWLGEKTCKLEGKAYLEFHRNWLAKGGDQLLKSADDDLKKYMDKRVKVSEFISKLQSQFKNVKGVYAICISKLLHGAPANSVLGTEDKAGLASMVASLIGMFQSFTTAQSEEGPASMNISRTQSKLTTALILLRSAKSLADVISKAEKSEQRGILYQISLYAPSPDNLELWRKLDGYLGKEFGNKGLVGTYVDMCRSGVEDHKKIMSTPLSIRSFDQWMKLAKWHISKSKELKYLFGDSEASSKELEKALDATKKASYAARTGRLMEELTIYEDLGRYDSALKAIDELTDLASEAKRRDYAKHRARLLRLEAKRTSTLLTE